MKAIQKYEMHEKTTKNQLQKKKKKRKKRYCTASQKKEEEKKEGIAQPRLHVPQNITVRATPTRNSRPVGTSVRDTAELLL